VGTAYRQRSQLLIFYFIFASVGYVLIKERREARKRQIMLEKQTRIRLKQQAQTRRRTHLEMERLADNLSEKIGF
jgi:hypothetical protein